MRPALCFEGRPFGCAQGNAFEVLMAKTMLILEQKETRVITRENIRKTLHAYVSYRKL